MRLFFCLLLVFSLTACGTSSGPPQIDPTAFANAKRATTIEVVPMLGGDLDLRLIESFLGSSGASRPKRSRLTMPPSVSDALVDDITDALSPHYEVSVAADPLIRFDMELNVAGFGSPYSMLGTAGFEGFEVVQRVTEESTADAVLFVVKYSEELPYLPHSPWIGGIGLYRTRFVEAVHCVYGFVLVDQVSGKVVATQRAQMNKPVNALAGNRRVPVVYRGRAYGIVGNEFRYPAAEDRYDDGVAIEIAKELLVVIDKSVVNTLRQMEILGEHVDPEL